MMSRRSSWLIVGILLIPLASAIGVPDLHIFQFRPRAFRDELVEVSAVVCGIIGILCRLFAPLSIIRDFAKIRRIR